MERSAAVLTGAVGPEAGPRSHGAPSARHRRRVTGLTTAALLAGLALTVLVAARVIEFGLDSPAAHLVLNTIDACIALLVAFLVYGRFLRQRLLRDLMLAQGLGLLAVAGFGLASLSQVFPDSSDDTAAVWLPLTVRVVGAALMAAAALAGDRRLPTDHPQRWLLGPIVIAVGGLSAAVWALADVLPVALEPFPAEGEMPLLSAHPALLAAQAFGAAAFAVAAATFVVEALRTHDELLAWLGPAFVLGAFARLNYLLFPSVYTDWLYTGDLLRTGFHVLLLIGAVREIQRHWHAQAEVAVLEDRRRLARELHDGVIQELSFIRSASHALPDGSRDSITGACDRALEEARAAVQALGTPAGEPLSATLERAVGQLADRYGVRVTLALDEDVVVDPEQRHALVRIAREAIHNAVRHGKARAIEVALTRSGETRSLSIRDDGHGFNVARAEAVASGYGLTSMRDRARGLPGELEIRSATGAGSVVTVQW